MESEYHNNDPYQINRQEFCDRHFDYFKFILFEVDSEQIYHYYNKICQDQNIRNKNCQSVWA